MQVRHDEFIAILDFGSQYAQLIARRIREQHVYCEIVSHDVSAADLAARSPRGIILSGGPASVYAEGAPQCDEGIFGLGVPILGICYGMQLGCRVLGGRVVAATGDREYGPAQVRVLAPGGLFDGLPSELRVWMSHGDRAEGLDGTFDVLAATEGCPAAAIRHRDLPFYGVQFHPEVTHTPQGRQMLANFLTGICQCRGTWQLGNYIDEVVGEIRREVGQGRVVCGLSGGVDSAVTAVLAHRAVGDRLLCIFVDNGLLREGERDQVEISFREEFSIPLHVVDATERFLVALRGVTDPEEKRRVIGHTFIDVFRDAAEDFPGATHLAQGTLYPDVIESRSPHGGPSARIKSHHNVGGLPEDLGFRLVEPLRFLFKDEVRGLAKELGFDDRWILRQPFPGPGLAVRVIGEVTAGELAVLRQVDAVVRREVEASSCVADLWQYFAVLLPVRSVGVMGDERTYENVAAVRAVTSTDGMTADWARLPDVLLERMSSCIINEVSGVNRVVYDISSKPPSTIEWE